MAAAKQMIPIN